MVNSKRCLISFRQQASGTNPETPKILNNEEGYDHGYES
jgi:hypothetical protein